MEIPLDYYRILGVPIQATDELLTQAYHDRSLQLPRREYSQYAIMARKQLLDQAYQVLSDSQKRKEYNHKFFAHNYSESNSEAVDTNQELEITEEKTKTVHFPTLDLSEDLLIGALLILQELGEYELVLNIAEPYISVQKELKTTQENTEQIKANYIDLILILTLSYLELGREEWQLGEYELAFNSQEQALNLLTKENVFPSLQEEIDNDLNKLKPYVIVAILSNENQSNSQRKKALNILQNILDERNGIEGQKIDKTGLNLDDFLRFIQQIRVYLTVTEQQELFENEAKRPSAAAIYLAVYALIAKGFSERKPALIVRAKNMLTSLTERQDVYLEQAICALLLGQTEEAEFALDQSQEEEAINYIKQNSEGSPDLLPGLCLYGEKWLQTELFSQFSNLNNQSSSLKEYFADEQVQNYLEDLYISPNQDVNNSSEQNINNRLPNLSNWEYPKKSVNNEELDLPSIANQYTEAEYSTEDSNTLTLVDAERENNLSEQEDLIPFDSFLTANLEDNSGASNRNNSQKKYFTFLNFKDNKPKANIKTKTPKNGKKISKPSGNNNLLWLIIVLLLGSGLAILAYNLVLNKNQEKLVLSINQPLLEIPENTTPNNPPNAIETLDNQTALEIVQNWLTVKTNATGAEHKIDEFAQILSEPLLSQWRSKAKYLEDNNAYRRYKHTMSIESVQINPKNPNQGVITAKINEVSQYYQDGVLNRTQSYDDTLKVRYDMIKKNNKWLINEIKVIK